MTGLSDDELRAGLARRVNTVPLRPEQRENLIRDARSSVSATLAPQPWIGRIWASVTAATAIVVLVVAIAPLLLTSPITSQTPAASRISGGASDEPDTPAPTDAVDPLHVYGAAELAGMIGDPEWAGRTVLGEATISPTRSEPVSCEPPDPCPFAVLDGVEGPNVVALSWRDAPIGQGSLYQGDGGARWLQLVSMPAAHGVHAFRIAEDFLELLGSRRISADGSAWSVPDLLRSAADQPSDDVYPVVGWLVETLAISCPAPEELAQTPAPALDYYCGGSWITASAVRAITYVSPDGTSYQTTLILDGALHVQHDAYHDFGVDPAFDEQGAVPQQGVYLVRIAGCPPAVMGDCPVWRMVGRLDGDAAAPPPLTEASSDPTVPTPSNPPSLVPQANEALEEGDLVRAIGLIMGSDEVGLRMCRPSGSLLPGRISPTSDPTPGCPPEVSVGLVGVAGETLPSWTPTGNGGRTGFVAVEGTWSSQAIRVDRVAAVERQFGRPDLPVACEAPPDGWPGEPPPSLEGEDAIRRIATLVEADPQEYGGYWGADLDPAAESESVIVVGVVGNVAAARETLKVIYPYNLCVIAVEYSAAELIEIESAIGPFTVSWMPSVDAAMNRVVVEVPYVDDAAASRVAPFGDAVVFDPIASKIGPPPP